MHPTEIAVINDDTGMALLLDNLLSRQGWRTAVYENGRQALERMAARPPPDLIITDIYMPGLDGWDLCRRLRSPEYPAFNRTPILVVSAMFAGAEVETLTAEMGANAFLPMPIEPGTLIPTVQTLLRAAPPAPDAMPMAPGADGSHKLRQAETLLAERTRRLHMQAMALDQIHDRITMTDLQGNITYVNDAACRMMGLHRAALLGKNVACYGEDPARGATQREIIEATLAHGQWRGEVVNRTAGGGEVILDCRTQLVHDATGAPVAMCGISTDITALKKTEQRLKAALTEKEILLRELYHRTKNNMQVITAMLALQAAHTKSGDVRNAFTEMQTRIHAMALVHQKLYQSNDLSKINLREYLTDLAQLLRESFDHRAGQVTLHEDIEPVAALIDIAIPCGLIVNELLSNAFKHAFPQNRAGNIRLSLRQSGADEIELRVTDDGVGTPADFDFHAQPTLGMRTIFAIAEQQLQGRVTFDGRHGMACAVKFSNTSYRQRI